MAINFQNVINMFLEGASSGRAGTKTSPGNLGIKQNQLIHYNTPIMERTDEGLIVNLSQYSIQTGRVQKMIKQTLSDSDSNYYVALKVPRDYKGSLVDYIVSN